MQRERSEHPAGGTLSFFGTLCILCGKRTLTGKKIRLFCILHVRRVLLIEGATRKVGQNQQNIANQTWAFARFARLT